jgi:hypothetical protein
VIQHLPKQVRAESAVVDQKCLILKLLRFASIASTAAYSPCASQLLRVKSSKKQPAHAHVFMLLPPANA